MANHSAPETHPLCRICGHEDDGRDPNAFGHVRGNTARFLDVSFKLWKCPRCQSIHSLGEVDFADIYKDYPLNRRRLDIFAKGTFRNLLGRLTRAGLKTADTVLDHGCGNGLFIDYLASRGYAHATGFDPFVPRFASLDSGAEFDCVIANDVIEHVADPRAMVAECVRRCRPGGLIYLGTADSDPVDMRQLEPQIMRLHQPFHRVILTRQSLERLALEQGLEVVATYRRSYMDTRMPFSNYRFLDEFNKALGHNMDLAFDPDAGRVIARHPKLLLYAFLGYWMPCADEPAVVLRKPCLHSTGVRDVESGGY